MEYRTKGSDAIILYEDDFIQQADRLGT
jgi:hypothetical protein